MKVDLTLLSGLSARLQRAWLFHHITFMIRSQDLSDTVDADLMSLLGLLQSHLLRQYEPDCTSFENVDWEKSQLAILTDMDTHQG